MRIVTLRVNSRAFVETMHSLDIHPFIYILGLLILTKLSLASIAGVTYMDDFDFEQRYRNLHECDPFYWHPLHLPDECVEMFGDLIRSNVRPPYTVVKERQPYTLFAPGHVSKQLEYNIPFYDHSDNIDSHETYAIPIEAELKIYQPRPLNPMDKLLQLLRSDVEENPSAPKVASVPYFGGVALYQQPVSFKTKAMIKTLSQAYAKAAYQT